MDARDIAGFFGVLILIMLTLCLVGGCFATGTILGSLMLIMWLLVVVGLIVLTVWRFRHR